MGKISKPEPIARFIKKLGAFAGINYTRLFPKHIIYISRLDLFSNYLNKAGNTNLFMINMLSLKIINWLSAICNPDIIYDDEVKLFGEQANR